MDGLRLIEEKLTDGSKVYAVKVGNTQIDCASEHFANELFVLLEEGYKKGQWWLIP